MSDDIVNRLRREAGTLATMYSAADEIERLRRLNSELTATHNKMVVWDARQADEIERLRAECVTIPEGYAVVPVEPTEAMVSAWSIAFPNDPKDNGTWSDDQCARADWSAMLSASRKRST